MPQTKILVAAVGMSPAVLTETIWALAHEKTPWIPNRVVAITTTEGRDRLRESLFGKNSEWESLQKTLNATEGQLRFGDSDSIRIIGDGQNDLSDISTGAENSAAADFILRVLREYTEDPNTEMVVSIAGGRKTMSALMLSCMTLLGREQDRVCHVLANDDYIFANKGFLFPRTKTEEKEAQIQLSDIPFVRIRGLYAQKLGEAPGSYSALVNQFQSAAPPPINYPKIVVYKTDGIITADGEDLRLSPKEFLLAAVLVENFLKAGKPFSSWDVVSEEIVEEMGKEHPFQATWHDKMLDVDYRKTQWHKVASDIRKKRLTGKPWASALIPSPSTKSTFPKKLITVRATRQSPARKPPLRTSADVRNSHNRGTGA